MEAGAVAENRICLIWTFFILMVFFGDFGDFESDLGANSTAATITEAQLTSERQICDF
jgi:hypothetical protein